MSGASCDPATFSNEPGAERGTLRARIEARRALDPPRITHHVPRVR